MTTSNRRADAARSRSRLDAVLTRRRFLQGFAAAGGGAVVGGAAWSALCRPTPVFAAHADRFINATATPLASSDLAVWTPTGTVERTQSLIIRASSTSPRINLWIHRVGGDAEAVWGCEDALVVDGATAEVAADWPTGLYLISATQPEDSEAIAFHPFVVTDQNSQASITVQVPFSTYQAYNAWAPADTPRRSLYDFNSVRFERASAVSIDRPYDGFDGAGFLFYGDQQLAEWLDNEGIDVNYISSWDTHHRPHLLDNTRLFISNFHDEYWSTRMRRSFEDRLAGGMNAAFFGANSMYWQVEIDGSSMLCDKVPGGPQGTFRSVRRPEASILGSQFESYRHPYGVVAADWVVADADHWVYADTGLAEGDVIERLVGYEWDRIPGDTPGEDVRVLASSPVSEQHHHHATIVERPGQGTVFNAGTNYWPRLLTGGGHWTAHNGVQQMTRNLISRLA